MPPARDLIIRVKNIYGATRFDINAFILGMLIVLTNSVLNQLIFDYFNNYILFKILNQQNLSGGQNFGLRCKNFGELMEQTVCHPKHISNERNHTFSPAHRQNSR